MHPKIHEYAEKLTATLPEPLKCVYFVNSGSEANDMAMMIARVYTGNFDILSFRNSYHGKYVCIISILITNYIVYFFLFYLMLHEKCGTNFFKC